MCHLALVRVTVLLNILILDYLGKLNAEVPQNMSFPHVLYLHDWGKIYCAALSSTRNSQPGSRVEVSGAGRSTPPLGYPVGDMCRGPVCAASGGCPRAVTRLLHYNMVKRPARLQCSTTSHT